MRIAAKTSIFPLLFLMAIFLAFASSCTDGDGDDDIGPSSGTMTDKDGNVYKTVTISTQTWMAENLRTTKYKDGTAIPNVTDSLEWFNLGIGLGTGAYCNYDNTSGIDTIYGRLYNWYAVNTGKLAPKGWHVPSDAEWTELIDYLGGESVAGGKLKETGTTHWLSPNIGATNETGFTALPGGGRDYYAAFYGIGLAGSWWSATENEDGYGPWGVWCRAVGYGSSYASRSHPVKTLGCSVRCVKD